MPEPLPKVSCSDMDWYETDADYAEKDPLEAIYALNIGDFLTDSFISDDLLNKISQKVASDPDKLKFQLEELVQIYSMDKTLSILGFEENEGFILYDSIAHTLNRMFQTDACHVFQMTYKDSGEAYFSLTGTSAQLSHQNRWGVGIGLTENAIIRQVSHEKRSLAISDMVSQLGWKPIAKLSQEGIQAVLLSPLISTNKCVGLLMFECRHAQAFSDELVHLAEATGRVMVTALQLQQLVSDAQIHIRNERAKLTDLQNLRGQITESIADLGQHQQAFLESLGAAVDARNHFTSGHSKHVADTALAIAEGLQLNEKTVDLVYYAALVGAIGKMDVPQAMLTKKDRLNQNEWETLRNHPNIGVGLLVQLNFLAEVVPYVHYQNERWDGTGPEGLAGKNIPLGSRILAVADAYQAMTRERPYREQPLSHEGALKALAQEVGSKWDPLIVETLSRIPADSLL